MIGKTDSVCDSSQMDDSGVVRAGGKYVVVTVDGMHSRLSDFPVPGRVPCHPRIAARLIRHGREAGCAII